MAAIIEIPWVAMSDDGSVLIEDDLVLLGPAPRDPVVLYSLDDGQTENGVATYFFSGWPTIAGAIWLWTHPQVQNPSAAEVGHFYRRFSVYYTPSSATIRVGKDNRVEMFVNGALVLDNSDVFTLNDVDILPYIQLGRNEIYFRITNTPMPGGTFATNPAGLIYRINIDP
jgi:hypothetical protein